MYFVRYDTLDININKFQSLTVEMRHFEVQSLCSFSEEGEQKRREGTLQMNDTDKSKQQLIDKFLILRKRLSYYSPTDSSGVNPRPTMAQAHP